MLTDARLSAIMEMLPETDIIADIGTDHGRLGAQLLLSGKCNKVWFSDLSSPSLEKARALTEKLSLQARAEFYLGDGAKAFPCAPGAAVIAGMGGVTISEIIKGAGALLKDTRLVLQPNVAVYEVRKTLMETGYSITDERCVIAAKRKYILIAAKPGESAYTYAELVAGPVLLKTKTPDFLLYALFRNRVLEKALRGALKGEACETDALRKEKAVWEEILS